MGRSTRIAIGALFVAVGLAGTLTIGLAQAVTAQPAGSTVDTHEVMETMMDAMHGPGMAERMHQGVGAEEMMDQCAAMMATRGGMMDGMMGERMMGGMMGSGR